MSNPYAWDFPQRNDTMYMSTIGLSSLTQKTGQAVGIDPAGSHLSSTETSKEPSLNSKFLKLLQDKILIIQPPSSRDLRTIRS